MSISSSRDHPHLPLMVLLTDATISKPEEGNNFVVLAEILLSQKLGVRKG